MTGIVDSDGNSQSDLNRINRSIKQNKNETVLNEALLAIPENVKTYSRPNDGQRRECMVKCTPFKRTKSRSQ